MKERKDVGRTRGRSLVVYGARTRVKKAARTRPNILPPSASVQQAIVPKISIPCKMMISSDSYTQCAVRTERLKTQPAEEGLYTGWGSARATDQLGAHPSWCLLFSPFFSVSTPSGIILACPPPHRPSPLSYRGVVILVRLGPSSWTLPLGRGTSRGTWYDRSTLRYGYAV